MSKTKFVGIDIPREFLAKFDAFVKLKGYNSRNEAIREAMRNLMNQGRERMRTP